MTPYEYFIEEGYPSEIAEELAKFLESYSVEVIDGDKLKVKED